ncbi:multidrug resistance protein mdtg [Anaeramoeba ignava]|uniref:Multidrug resistance protein mdtg n=1 Tax=Anaeramoeba ignava TaxID=1746090 RepID=A0A9Q0L9X9_ANAIG|nr:multidrug resistance protein mdtg [Anaeramoeba ignava]
MNNRKIDTEDEIEIDSVVIPENYKSNNNTRTNLEKFTNYTSQSETVINLTTSFSTQKSMTGRNSINTSDGKTSNLNSNSNGNQEENGKEKEFDEKKISIQKGEENPKENQEENQEENSNENSNEKSNENQDPKKDPNLNQDPKKDPNLNQDPNKKVKKGDGVDKVAVFTVYFCLFLAVIAFSILIPIIPFYAYEHYHVNALKIGAIEATYSGTQFISSFILGILSDKKFGRKKLLVICLFGLMIGLFVTSFSRTIIELTLYRGLTGIFGGFISLTSAMIADLVPNEYRAKYMGYSGGMFGFALAIGPSIGSSLSQWGLKGVSYASAGLTFIGFLFALIFLKETYVVEKKLNFTQIVAIAEEVPVESLTFFKALWLLLKRPFLVRFQASLFFSNLGFTGIMIIYPLLCEKLQIGLDQSNIGYVYMMTGFTLLIVQGGAMSFLANKIHLQTMVYVMVPFGGAMIAVLPEAKTKSTDILVMFLISVSSAFRVPCLMALVSFTTKRTDKGIIMGIAQSSSALSRTIGPVVAGSIFDANYKLGFWISGALLILSGFMMLGPKIRFMKPKEEIELGEIKIEQGTLPEFEKRENYSQKEWFESSDDF